MIYLGIDIGGTGIKAGLVSDQGQVLQQAEAPTRASEGPQAVMERVEQLARSLLDQSRGDVLGCGLGVPGRIDHREGRVLLGSANLPGWTGLDLKARLESRLELPVAVDNDVNAAALGEGWTGAGRRTADFLMITIGTGVGGALVIGGQLWRGAHSGAGEVGHMALYPGQANCPCGGTGCAEQYLSAKALTRRANQELTRGHPFRGIRDVLAAAQRGALHRRGAARRAVERFTQDLAFFLINLQNLFDPEIVIIGGGIVQLGYWWDRLLEALAGECHPRSVTVRAKRARGGPLAGVVGAARLAMLVQGRAAPPVPRRTGRLESLVPVEGRDGNPHRR